MKSAVIVGLLALLGSAQAADWRIAARAGDLQVSVEVERLRVRGQVRAAWTHWEYQATQVLSDGTRYQRMKRLDEVDCQAKTDRVRSWVLYARDGEVVRSWEDESSRFREVVPDSIADALLGFMCSYGGAPPAPARDPDMEWLDVKVPGWDRLITLNSFLEWADTSASCRTIRTTKDRNTVRACVETYLARPTQK